MNSVDIKIEKNENGEDEVTLIANISLGKLLQERGIKDGHKFITCPPSLTAVIKIMEDAIFRNLNTESLETDEEIKELQDEIRSYMQEYAKAFILNTFGVKHAPILIDEKGNYIGFKNDITVNVIE